MNYYSFHIGDYASHTRHLTLMEDLAYRRLLDEYYLHERPLNVCSTDVARQIGMRDHEDVVTEILNAFFVLTEAGWVNKRADEQISKYHDKLEKASRAGSASAAKRMFNVRSTDVQPTNNQEPVTNISTPITPKGAIGIEAFIESCKRSGEKPVPEDDPVFAYADKVGIPVEYLRLCWREFVDRNKENGKRYKDWRKAYRNCVRSNWYKIWFISHDGSVSLSTQGMAASKMHQEAA